MRITIEFFINFLIKYYENRNSHEDIKNIYKDKLNVLLKNMNLKENSIYLNHKNKFEFSFLNSIYVEDEDDLKKWVESDLNRMLEYLTMEYTIHPKGMLSTTKKLENYYEKMRAFNNDLILRSHQNAKNIIYKENIKNILEFAFTGTKVKEGMEKRVESFKKLEKNVIPFFYHDGIEFNNDITNEQELEIMNKTYDEYDYY